MKDGESIRIKKVLVVGAKGQLGVAVVSALKDTYMVTAIDQKELDITEEEKVFSLVQNIKPEIIINAAAYNKVEQANKDVIDAYAVNAFGPYYLAQAARSVGAFLVHISSDYVFGNEKQSYAEHDLPGPLNAYGASKLAGEHLVMSGTSHYFIIRTSALYGGEASDQKINFVDKMIQLSKTKDEISVVDDQYTSPTYVVDLSRKIRELILISAPPGIYHITNSGSCSWFQLAKEIFAIKGISTRLKSISTVESGSRIQRPKSTILINSAIKDLNIQPLRSWQTALQSYLM